MSRTPSTPQAVVPTGSNADHEWMARPKYYCYQCKGNHYFTSKIGRQHRAAANPFTARRRTATKKRSRSKRPGSRSVRRPSPMPAAEAPRGAKPAREPVPAPASSQHRGSARLVVHRSCGPAANAVAVIVFDADSRYRLMADEILARMPWYRRSRRGHWLCRQLEEAAQAFSPGTYLERVGDVVAKELRRRGLPRFVAEVVARSLTTVTGRAVGSLGTDQLVATLRALIPLVCPDFERCRTQQSVCAHFLAPGVEEALRSAL